EYTSGMYGRIPLPVLFLFPALAFAQPGWNSVTVTASRSNTIQSDQLVFSISVHSGPDKNLDDIVSALQPLGVTAANFAGLGNSFGILAVQTPPDAPGIYWLFRLPVPVSKYKDTTAQLAALQQSIASMKIGLTLSFSLQGSQASPQALQAAGCDWSGLVAD